MAARLSDRTDWFDIWFDDKKSMISTMVKNMVADLEAGYDFFGASIQRQQQEIDTYRAKFDSEMDAFKMMDEKEVNRWCFYDLKKRGAID